MRRKRGREIETFRQKSRRVFFSVLRTGSGADPLLPDRGRGLVVGVARRLSNGTQNQGYPRNGTRNSGRAMGAKARSGYSRYGDIHRRHECAGWEKTMFLLARYTVAAAVFLSASAASAVEENLSADQMLPGCAAFIAERAPREIDGVFQAGRCIGLMQGPAPSAWWPSCAGPAPTLHGNGLGDFLHPVHARS
jgi:hypothetical protein